MNYPFSITRHGQTSLNIIRLLREQPMLREPMLRKMKSRRNRGKKMKGERFIQRVGSALYKVESAMVQIVGTLSEESCNACGNGRGPWATCVAVKDVDGIFSACANCRWDRRDGRCRL